MSLRYKFREISVNTQKSSANKMYLSITSAKFLPFCLGLNISTHSFAASFQSTFAKIIFIFHFLERKYLDFNLNKPNSLYLKSFLIDNQVTLFQMMAWRQFVHHQWFPREKWVNSSHWPLRNVTEISKVQSTNTYYKSSSWALLGK